jgi:hypothetical protein
MSPAQPPQPDDPTHPAGLGRGWWRPIAYALGVALVALAVWAVWRQGDALAAVLAAVRAAPGWMAPALAGLTILNWLLSAGVFWVLTRRRAPITGTEMLALTAASWLLNFLPARAGLVGRLAYQRRVHGISLRNGAMVVVWSMAATALAALAALLAAIALGPLAAGATLAALGAGLLAAGWARAGNSFTHAFAAAAGLRTLEMIVWCGRYLLVFAMVGHAVPLDRAALYAAAAQAAGLVPVPMGVREWTIGLLATTPAIGLSADLLNRGAEVAVAAAAGGWGLWWLSRAVARAGLAR